MVMKSAGIKSLSIVRKPKFCFGPDAKYEEVRNLQSISIAAHIARKIMGMLSIANEQKQ